MTTLPKSRFFRTLFDTIVASRQRQADRYVTAALLMLDDETLQSQGYRRPDLARRAKAYPL